VNRHCAAKYATRVVTLSAIRSFSSLCCARGWSASNPSQGVVVRRDTLDQKQLEPGVREPFTEQEIRSILQDCKATGQVFRQFAVAAANELGLRLGAICQLQWEAFCKAGVVIVTGKHKQLELPISEELADIVLALPSADLRYLFPRQRAMMADINRCGYLSMQFKRICGRLGIGGKSFQCLRRSVAAKVPRTSKAVLLEKIAEAILHGDIEKLLSHSTPKEQALDSALKAAKRRYSWNYQWGEGRR
jgi:integrase